MMAMTYSTWASHQPSTDLDIGKGCQWLKFPTSSTNLARGAAQKKLIGLC